MVLDYYLGDFFSHHIPDDFIRAELTAFRPTTIHLREFLPRMVTVIGISKEESEVQRQNKTQTQIVMLFCGLIRTPNRQLKSSGHGFLKTLILPKDMQG